MASSLWSTEPAAESTSATPTQGTDSQALDPIDILTGNSFQRESDYAPAGLRMDRAQLTLTRYYNSLSHRSSHSLGYSWSHTYHTRVLKRDGEYQAPYVVVQADGRWLNFWPAPEGGGEHRTSDPRQGSLWPTDTGYRWVLPDQRVLQFRRDGQLKQVNDAFEGQLTLAYNGDDRLHTVTDHHGRQLTFSYSQADQGRAGLRSFDSITGDLSDEEQYLSAQGFQGRLISVTLPNHHTLRYDYHASGLLARVSRDNTTQRDYRYDNASFPTGLTAIVQADGQTKATWDYDHQGRVIDFA